MKEEVEFWKKKDPIPRFEKYLTERKLLTEELKKEIAAEITVEINEAVEFADQSPYPQPEEALQHVWAET